MVCVYKENSLAGKNRKQKMWVIKKSENLDNESMYDTRPFCE